MKVLVGCEYSGRVREAFRKRGHDAWSCDLLERALNFVRALMAAKIKRKAIENPISVISSKIRKPDQIIHPWMFGHGETKATCLWLDGLPLLKPTNVVEGREHRIHLMPPSTDRWKDRSRTYQGIADAFAEQWG